MFEKLSNSMRGNQNARKNPLAMGVLSGLSVSGVAILGTTAKRVADARASFSDLKMGLQNKGPGAKKLVSKSVATLKAAAVQGAKSGFNGSSKVALGVGVGVGAAMAARKKL
jgi:hypothetical protein